VADVAIRFCEPAVHFAIPPNVHVPHADRDTRTGGALEWVVSGGMVASPSTSPTHRMKHRMTLGGEGVAGWFDE
jgi:hypothetical protein